MLNQFLQRVWNRSDPATALTRLSEQRSLTVDPVTDSHVLTLIQRMMRAEDNRFGAIFSVRQATTEAAFNAHVRQRPNRKTLALWHDDPDGLALLQTEGVRPGIKAERHPFGQGIHFTDHLNNPFKPHDLKPGRQQPIRYRAICEVHVGNHLELTSHRPQPMNAVFLNSLDEGYDSVVIHQRNNLPTNAFIVYNTAQYTIRYLVQLNA